MNDFTMVLYMGNATIVHIQVGQLLVKFHLTLVFLTAAVEGENSNMSLDE